MTGEFERLTEVLGDRFRLVREIGSGGMATVYLAEELKHRRPVALKVLRPELAQAIGADHFLREIEVTARLDHPHILALLDSGEAAGMLYYAMPYVDGESLRERLNREKQLPIEEAVEIAREVADALSYAHGHGIVHRDIKPENILLAGRHARVADFGIARAVTAAGEGDLTRTGMRVGTPRYMSPEQASGETVDGRSDVYALGCMLYEMLAGQPPFSGPTVESILRQHLTAEPPSVRSLRPAVPPFLESAIARALAKSPADRFRDAGGFAAALIPTEGTGASVPPVRVRSRRLVVLCAAAALAVVAGASLWNLLREIPPITIGRTTQLTTEDGLEIDPALSPDGRLLAYVAGNAAVMRIFIRPVGGGRTIALSEGATAFELQPRWSPDSTQILYLTPEGAFVASALGGSSRRVDSGSERPGSFASASASGFGPVNAAAWSPDGQRMFVARGGSFAIVPLDGGAERPLGTAPAELHSCQWSPSGGWIACVAGNWSYVRPGPNFGNLAPSDLVLVSPTDGRVVVLSDSTATHQSPAWSPDGRQLYFVSDAQGPSDVYAVEVTAAGAARRAPRRVTVGLGAHSVALSADARRLVYVTYSARANVWSLPIPARGPVNLAGAVAVTRGNQTVESMTVSRDGRWLLYDSNVNGNSDIFRVPLSGGSPERLTTDPSGDFVPDLSPDGQFIAYHSWRTGSRDIFVQPVAGGPPQQVTATPSQESYPAWSPDGQAIAFFDQFVPGNGVSVGLFIVRREAGGWGPPVARRAGARRPSWSPDGRWLAYSLGRGIEVIAPMSGEPRVIYAPSSDADPEAENVAVSGDGGTIYFKSHDSEGRASLWAIAASGGRPRLLVQFDDLSRPSTRRDFAAGAGRFFFTVDDRQSDLWLAEVTQESSR